MKESRNEISIFKIIYVVCHIFDRVTGIGRADVIDIYRKMDRFLEKKNLKTHEKLIQQVIVDWKIDQGDGLMA